MSYYNPAAPVDDEKALPIAALGQCRRRKIIRSYDVEKLALKSFDSSGTGITVSHIQAAFGINKEHARRIVKRLRTGGKIFAPENHKPQRYYPTIRRPQVVEHLDNKRRLLVEATGTHYTSSQYALYNAIENQKANNFLDSLCLLPLCPRFIHNFHMATKYGKQYYQDIETFPRNRTKGKLVRERIGHCS